MYISRAVVFGLIAVVLVVLAVVLLDFLIVTEDELVRATVHQLAADLQRNDVDAVVAHISDQSPELQQEARKRLAQVTIDRATVKRNLETVVSQGPVGWVATAKFNGVLVLSDQMGLVNRQTVARYFVIYLRKEDGRWRVSRYEDLDPIRRE
jgi:ketosteroid isomerase-like protein